jgi:hypothetical protein
MLTRILRDIAKAGLQRARGESTVARCPVCTGEARILGEVDFNKSCEDRNGMLLPKSHQAVRYFLCDGCGFCFAPEFRRWSDRRFKERIYNDDYVLVDPEYAGVRPERTAEFVDSVFGRARDRASHLDFGGGSGLTSRLLRDRGWQSSSHDHFVDGRRKLSQAATYDLVTAWEVFEHVADPRRLMADLSRVAHPQSVIMFSTLLSDGHIGRGQALDWWYLAPRNGHVSLYSRTSLATLLRAYGFKVFHLNEGTHVAFRELPGWCNDLPIFQGA